MAGGTAAHTARCAELKAGGHEAAVRATTGLVLDPYFSGTKLAWILDHVEGARTRAEAGELAFGTVDSFLVWRLSGAARAHVTDVTNASRTLLMRLATLDWDDAMLRLLGVPRAVLPRIVGSAEVVAVTQGFGPLPGGTPIAKHRRRPAGTGPLRPEPASPWGTPSARTGREPSSSWTSAPLRIASRFGLLTTVAWKVGGDVAFALEGSAFIAGAAVQWLRDGLGIVKTAADIEALARSVPSSDGVTFVPALSGLGAPYWDPEARGLVCGLTRGSTAAHLARATLEGVALEVRDLLGAMADDLGKPLGKMRVDGGAAANDLLMQFQADVAAVAIERPAELESTARGAAMLAGVGAGLFSSLADAAGMSRVDRSFKVEMGAEERRSHLDRWADAIARARLAPTFPRRPAAFDRGARSQECREPSRLKPRAMVRPRQAWPAARGSSAAGDRLRLPRGAASRTRNHSLCCES